MKHLPLALLVLLFSLQWPTSCVSQHKQIQPTTPIVTNDIYRTTDGIHYFRTDDKQPMNGTYDIYETETVPGHVDLDAVSSPIKVTGNRHSTGTFTKGLKTGVWRYYQGERKIKEETYRAGRPVSTRKCPCPK
ncbi:hypothetical protein [Hymenobacter lucidus]|uniref:Uncharacterized protein n=1 Tax=Hymenobacter lucidus TaxID=2880930 RepID=A0ABS8AUQ1_9BACT|nr:hypothetical protein [Hymenobacter lucidus]MCB2409511.1 hypothetical protein [Hymenobacter lucidus]